MPSAIALWRQRVKAHHAQSIRAQGGREPSQDFWQPLAPGFRADPHRTDDATLNVLLRDVAPHETVLDVGGGGGRFALPLALRCRHVTVVEPSLSMVEVLRDGIAEARIPNLTVAHSVWEQVEVAQADVVLCAHVLYGVEDMKPFVQALGAHAMDRVIVPLFMSSPQVHLAPMWQRVHGEARVTLPGVPELLDVLWEMGIYPDLEMLEGQSRHTYENRQAALSQLRRRVYVQADTPEDQRLHEAMSELLVETPEGSLTWEAPLRRLGILRWRPNG